MKRTLILLLIMATFTGLRTFAQGSASFQFLQLPVSAHASALGGVSVTASDDDHTLAFLNPALLSGTTGSTLGLCYMNFLQGSNMAGASYNVPTTGRSAFAFGAQYLGFGTMRRTDAEGADLGDFTAKDMALTGIYSYALSDLWSGGVTAKVVYSNYDIVYSLALGIDLGLNYFNPDTDLSFSIVARNLGGQVKTYDDVHEPLPADLVAGVSKRLAHAPVRLTLTLTDLTRWQASDFYSVKPLTTRDLLFRHVAVGADIFPTETTWVAVGYNQQLHSALSTNGARSLAGFTMGAGINVSKLKVGVAYGRYHIASNSLLMNISYGL